MEATYHFAIKKRKARNESKKRAIASDERSDSGRNKRKQKSTGQQDVAVCSLGGDCHRGNSTGVTSHAVIDLCSDDDLGCVDTYKIGTEPCGTRRSTVEKEEGAIDLCSTDCSGDEL